MKVSFVVILFLILKNCQAETELEVIMIADVINSIERPSAAIATVCWTSNEKKRLFSRLKLKNEKTAMQFHTQDKELDIRDQNPNIILIVDLNCPNISMFIQMSQAIKLFRSPIRWLLFYSNKDEGTIPTIVPEELEGVDILIDAEVIVARRVGNVSYDFHMIYKLSSQGSWKTEFFGYWNLQNKLTKFIDAKKVTALRRINLEGYQIPVCYVLTDNDSINHLTDGMNDHIDTITKANFPVTNYLLDFLNASRKYVFVETWGYRLNGTWNGMTGFLVREEVEIGGSPMFFTSERVSYVEYISSPTPTRSKFVFQQPKLSYENNLFLLSFRTTVWYSSAALLFVMFLALLAVAFWEWKKNKQYLEKRNKNAGILRANVVDVVLLIFSATCQQGSTVELKGSLGRVVLLVLFLTLMFLYTSYSANIVALLQSSSSQIRTLEDLLKSRIKFGVHDTVFNRYYFSTASEPTRKAIYQKKVAPPGSPPRFMSMEEGVKNMRKGLFAFHMETGVGYKFVGKYFQEGEKCGLKEIQYLQVIDPWLAVRKYTPFKEMYKIGMKRIQEHGLQTRENHLLYEKKPKCSGRGGNFVSVGMVDCYPALLVLSYGILVSIVILIMEIIAHRKKSGEFIAVHQW